MSSNIGDERDEGKQGGDPLRTIRDLRRTLDDLIDPVGIRRAIAGLPLGAKLDALIDPLGLRTRAKFVESPLGSTIAKLTESPLRAMFARLDVGRARLDEIAQHIREQDEAHRAELEAAWRGELPPDPMPREYPSTLAAEVMLERAEGRFRVAHFVRFGRSADAWARWLSMREIAFASALGAMAFAHTSPAKRRAIAAEYEARANRARAWTDAKAREKAIRCALYELLEAYRVHPDEADAKNIATSWMLEAPELGDVDALRVVRGVSLASTLEAWRTTAEGKRNRGAKLYATLSQFFRRVAGMAQVREATVETESRDARAAWRKPKRAMPAGRRSKKKGKR